jgi:hypothetical protein
MITVGGTMDWMSTSLATALVGALAGLIFFFDGWKRNPKEMIAFNKTFRITGLAWLVGGGVISGVLTYIAKTDQSKAMIAYVISFALIAFVSLAVGTVSMAFYYIVKNYGNLKFIQVVIDAIPFTLFFLANGIDATLERISQTDKDRAAFTISTLERSRLRALQFVNAANGFINEDLRDGRTGVAQFKLFLAVHMQIFVVMFFEQGDLLEKYRAAFFERKGDVLLFTVAADNKGSGHEFGGQPLELDSTLAGKAFTNNEIYVFPKDKEIAYKKLPGESRYKSFIVVPVPYKPNSAEAERIGVLSVDGMDENAPFQAEFQNRLLIYFSNVMATAHSTYLGRPGAGVAKE